MGNFSERPSIYSELATSPLDKRLVLESQRLSILEVLKHLQKPETEPRQPHDSFDGLVTEAHIAEKVFDTQILPALTAILSARRAQHGPEKKYERVKDKVAKKVGIEQARLDEYKASGRIHFGQNCDYTRSMQTVGTMTFIQRATDMFQERGIVTINKGDGSKPLNIVVLDVENGFVEEVGHKPNLMRINLKLAVPISLKDGTETFHVLEHKIFLKASLKNEMDGTAVWQECRELDKREQRLTDAFCSAASNSPESKALLTEFEQVSAQKTEASKRRAEINARDFKIKGIGALIGYTPESKTGSVRGMSWTFTPLDEVVVQMAAQKRNTLVPLHEKAFALA